ncbi:MAG: protein-L-isoaspartate(D-aspartate) O-methyltransferase [Phycisphaerae bacterium]|nr:protein-L-isoaspartate(D-aspartate) O-methyltransferase [Phycisphaerae bacterium]
MVEQIADYGVGDADILAAMGEVPRHWFVNEGEQPFAYDDRPLPIGHGQTISQPFIVAYMTRLLEPDADAKVLEIGTGSGYQAAVLNEFTPHVFTIEIVEPLGRQARERFAEHGYSSIQTHIGDGYKGWPEHAPFDAIIVTCAPDAIPQALIDQLKPTGRMVIPVGGVFSIQQLVLVTKERDGSISQRSMMPVRFVPMVPDNTPQ